MLENIETVQQNNVFTDQQINFLIDEYNKLEKYDGLMNKGESGVLEEEWFVSIIKKFIKIPCTLAAYNFYKIDDQGSYLPHTDFILKDGCPDINVNIPLYYTGSKIPHLVIFDQRYLENSVTWCLDYEIQYFKHNTGVSGRPCDYDITDKTNESCNQELYDKHLKVQGAIDNFYSLSGKAYPLIPKSILMFDNTRIHCTGQLEGERLGISVSFSSVKNEKEASLQII